MQYKTVKDVVDFLKNIKNKTIRVKTYFDNGSCSREIKLIGNKNITVEQFIKFLNDKMLGAGSGNKPCETLNFMPFIKVGTEFTFLRVSSIKESKFEVIINLTT